MAQGIASKERLPANSAATGHSLHKQDNLSNLYFATSSARTREPTTSNCHQPTIAIHWWECPKTLGYQWRRDITTVNVTNARTRTSADPYSISQRNSYLVRRRHHSRNVFSLNLVQSPIAGFMEGIGMMMHDWHAEGLAERIAAEQVHHCCPPWWPWQPRRRGSQVRTWFGLGFQGSDSVGRDITRSIARIVESSRWRFSRIKKSFFE